MIRRTMVVFYLEGRELLRYTLKGEAPEEREQTARLLAYERKVPVEKITYRIVDGENRLIETGVFPTIQ